MSHAITVKVVKTNMMKPFCVRHHVDVHVDSPLVAFVKTNTQKKFITPKLSPLCMLTKTRFDRLAIGDWVFNFPITKLDDQTFWSSTFNHHNRRLKISNCQLSGIKVGNQIFFNLPQKKFRSCPKFLVLQLIVASNPLTRFLLSLLKFFWALLEKFDH